jgi:pimeloyl-ACP methyl ester carboxylesterase
MKFEYKGHQLNWSVRHTGDHTFVLIPGWSGVASMWESTIARLQPYGRCVLLDLPGHYPSQAPADYTSLSQTELLDLETCAVQQICGNGPLTLVGHSTGGLVALGIAARLPNQVKQVITVNSVVWGPLTGVLGLAQWLVEQRLYGLFWSAWKYTQLSRLTCMFGMMFYVHHKYAHWTNRTAWHLTQSVFPLFQRHSLKNLAIMLRLLQHCDIRALSRDLTIPVLVITGMDDPIVPSAQSVWLGQNLPCSEVHIIDKVGHLPFMEAPAEYESVLTHWLIKHMS